MENASFQSHVVDLDARELEFLNDQNFVPVDARNFRHELLLPLCQWISGQLNAGKRIIVELLYWIEATFSEGGSVETSTSESSSFGQFYWPCRVLRLKGYYVLLKPESITEDSEPIWAHLLSEQIFPAGYLEENQIKPRKPNHCFIGLETFKYFVASCYFGEPYTFPSTLHNRVDKKFRRLKINRLLLNPRQVIRFRKDMEVEVRDPEYLSDYHVGRVTNIVGSRVEVTYRDLDENDENLISKTVWCDKDSDTIQPCGWCDTVGHSILCENYDPTELDIAGLKYENFYYGIIEIGQQLEVIHPLDPSRLHVATVTKLLKFGYIIVRVESRQTATEFCVHLSSPEIFPFGFAGRNKIERVKPVEAQPNKKQKRKSSQIEINQFPLVPESLLQKLRELPRKHCFAVNMKLEAADWFNVGGNLICPATVIRVVNDGNYQLLKIRYDGYGKEFEQWLTPSSCEIYPVGYSKLVHCPLQPPGPMRFTVKRPQGHNNEEEELTYASEALTRSDAVNEIATANLRLNSAGNSRNIMEYVAPDRALNPFEWTCQDLKQFLERNNYWGSSLLRDILPDSIDGKTLTSFNEIDVGRMVEHYEDVRSRSCCLESLVNLINYLRVLHCGYQM